MQGTVTDYIIVGHGIAGALLGYFLEQEGARCLYFDSPQQVGATQVAAGIINPITGRRFVKSWRVATLLPMAQQLYRQLEEELGISFYHEQALIRTLFNRGDENTWQARMLDEAYTPYFRAKAELGQITEATKPAFSYLEVAQTAQVSIGKLCTRLQEVRTGKGVFLENQFRYELVEITPAGAYYDGYTAKKIIFCEGWRSRFNPWFQQLPYGGNKGEVLLVRLPEVELKRMFKHRIFIVPFEDDLYWVGATSDNQFTDDQPTEQGQQYLRDRLAEVLTTPFEIVEHRAAVRPTVKDRRPYLGTHPEHPQLAMFNGLGTKGASLAPFWAKHFAEHLMQGMPLDPEVDISRFIA